MRKAVLASAGAVALVVALGPASVASSAQTAKVSGPAKVFVHPNNTTSPKHPGTVLLTGTIGDYGKATKVNAKGKPTAKGKYRELALKKGTILINITAFGQALTKAYAHPTFDKTTCSISVTATGTIAIVSGTKAYTGITGSFMLTANLAYIGPIKKGVCTMKTTTPALATYTEITGSGTVTLP